MPFHGSLNPPHLHRRAGGWRVQTPADIFDQRARGTFIAPETEASELLDFDQGALKLFRCSTAALDHRAVPRVARDPPEAAPAPMSAGRPRRGARKVGEVGPRSPAGPSCGGAADDASALGRRVPAGGAGRAWAQGPAVLWPEERQIGLRVDRPRDIVAQGILAARPRNPDHPPEPLRITCAGISGRGG